MRTTADRIRHALSFEIIGLILVTPLAGWAFDVPLAGVGIVAAVTSVLATVWNYVYNLLFDHAMMMVAGTVRKTVVIRVLHAVLFETGLLIVMLPFIAWYLDISLIRAFLLDVSFAVFYLGYAFVFNWAYDLVFPVPEAASGQRS